MTEEIRLYRAAGGSAIVSLDTEDVPPYGDALALRRIAEITGVHIIKSIGYGASDTWTPELFEGDIAKYLERVTNVLNHSPVKPGHLVSSLKYFDLYEKNALRAVARAAKGTGLSLTVCLLLNPEELVFHVI